MSLGQNDNALLKLLADEQLRKENAALVRLQLETLEERNKAEAENERLKKEKHEMTFQINIDDALAAENERLRKAGDELLGNYYATLSDVSDFEKLPSVAQWLAAKEGRETK